MGSRTTRRSREIRSFLLSAIPEHPRDLVAHAGRQFGLSRQALHRHMRALLDDGLVTARGRTRQRMYALAVRSTSVSAEIARLEEDVLWRRRIEPLLPDLPARVHEIWAHGFTAMINNAIEHSGGTEVHITVETTAVSTRICIVDDGAGIFRKLRDDLGLADERHALLELAKGKLTTDPDNHTGEGIFFSSRMFDDHAILSGGICLSHGDGAGEEAFPEAARTGRGTAVFMALRHDSPRTTGEVLRACSAGGDEHGFTLTAVPVRLLQHGAERLVSRSQARRLLARLEQFKVVILDFAGVDSIGRAFADEIFRIFARRNPQVRIVPANTTARARRMVRRAREAASQLP